MCGDSDSGIQPTSPPKVKEIHTIIQIIITCNHSNGSSEESENWELCRLN